MPRYFVSLITLEGGEHIIHQDGLDCPLAPSAGERLDLGELKHGDQATQQARREFDLVDGCPTCMPENNDSADADAINAAVAAVITVGNM